MGFVDLGRRFTAGTGMNGFSKVRFRAESPADTGQLEALTQRYPVFKDMLELIRIPSATPQDNPIHRDAVNLQLNRMRDILVHKFKTLGIQDNHILITSKGSLIIQVPGSPGYEDRQPLLLTAHMDIVAGDPQHPTKPVKPQLQIINGHEYLTSDGTTTLGADDKSGIAIILDNVARLLGKHPEQKTPLPHAPLEILFSPDEESGCESLKDPETAKLIRAKHVIVVDEFELGKVTTGLASSIAYDITLKGMKGGHSGQNIHDETRLNGILLMGELLRKLKNGVIRWTDVPGLPLISKSVGVISGGNGRTAIPNEVKVEGQLRSFDEGLQNKELERMKRVIHQFQDKYRSQEPGLEIEFKPWEKYPAWTADRNSPLPQWATAAAQQVGLPKVEVGPTHAAAQASILGRQRNAFGEPFDAVLIGCDIHDAHQRSERVQLDSILTANQWLGFIIQEYRKNLEIKTPN